MHAVIEDDPRSLLPADLCKDCYHSGPSSARLRRPLASANKRQYQKRLRSVPAAFSPNVRNDDLSAYELLAAIDLKDTD